MDKRTLSPMTMDVRTVTCEFLGTLLLVFFAVGAAVASGEFIGTLHEVMQPAMAAARATRAAAVEAEESGRQGRAGSLSPGLAG
jgi:pyruvate/2-oxoglutarate dehydrogenase complex dihydrolipoamide acyltransferase (E2) component